MPMSNWRDNRLVRLGAVDIFNMGERFLERARAAFGAKRVRKMKGWVHFEISIFAPICRWCPEMPH